MNIKLHKSIGKKNPNHKTFYLGIIIASILLGFIIIKLYKRTKYVIKINNIKNKRDLYNQLKNMIDQLQIKYKFINNNEEYGFANSDPYTSDINEIEKIKSEANTISQDEFDEVLKFALQSFESTNYDINRSITIIKRDLNYCIRETNISISNIQTQLNDALDHINNISPKDYNKEIKNRALRFQIQQQYNKLELECISMDKEFQNETPEFEDLLFKITESKIDFNDYHKNRNDHEIKIKRKIKEKKPKPWYLNNLSNEDINKMKEEYNNLSNEDINKMTEEYNTIKSLYRDLSRSYEYIISLIINYSHTDALKSKCEKILSENPSPNSIIVSSVIDEIQKTNNDLRKTQLEFERELQSSFDNLQKQINQYMEIDLSEDKLYILILLFMSLILLILIVIYVKFSFNQIYYGILLISIFLVNYRWFYANLETLGIFCVFIIVLIAMNSKLPILYHLMFLVSFLVSYVFKENILIVILVKIFIMFIFYLKPVDSGIHSVILSQNKSKKFLILILISVIIGAIISFKND